MVQYLKKSKTKYVKLKKLKENQKNQQKQDLLKRINKKKEYSQRFKSLGVKKTKKMEHKVAWGVNQPLINTFKNKSMSKNEKLIYRAKYNEFTTEKNI